MNILLYPDPKLFQPTEPVTEFNDELKEILTQMLALMDKNNGLGLAANQVGIMKSMFVMRDNTQAPLFIINPVIKQTDGNCIINEGCLSMPEIFVQVFSRATNIAVEFQNENGEIMQGLFSGQESVCFQHEMEHLQGKFFIDNLNRNQRRGIVKEYERKKRNG